MKQNRGFFASSIGLQLRLLSRRLPALLCMVLAIFLLAGAAAGAAEGLLGASNFVALDFAVAVEDDDPRVEPLLGLVTSVPEISDYATVHLVDTQTALDMVESGQAAAALVLPKGFLASVLTGENMAPILVVDSSRPTETVLISKLAQSTVRILTDAQQGIYYTIAVYDLYGLEEPARSDFIYRANLKYFEWVLGADSMFAKQTVNTTGQLSVMQHYLLCMVLFFLMLATPILHRLFAMKQQAGWVARLKASGCPLWKYTLSQLLVGVLGVLVMELLLLAGVGIVGGGSLGMDILLLVPAVLLSAAFITCFGYLCCNLGSMLATVSINFLLAVSFLLVGGGLLPRALLPAPLAALEPFSPINWMMRALQPLFGVRPDGQAMLALGLGCAVLAAGCFAFSFVTERRRKTA